MNIFVLDFDAQIAAENHCDKHVIKMLLESCQIMCTVLHLQGVDPTTVPYKATHKHHPCVLWANESSENYKWLWTLAFYLSKEYTKRYNKTHACDKLINSLLFSTHPSNFPGSKLTPFVQAMPEKYKVPGDAITAYRNYYMGDKKYFAVWKLNNTPTWWK